MAKQSFVSTSQALVLEVEEYMKQHLPQYVEELRELCSIDSPSYHKPGLDEVGRILTARMRRIGMEVTLFEQEEWGNDFLGIMQGEGDGVVLLVGHIDTVYPVGIGAERPLRIEADNIVYGPGVSDMKGCVLSAIYSLEALLARGIRPFKELRFLCLTDEEYSTRHSEDLIRRVAQGCDAAFVLESGGADGNLVSARKGAAHFVLKVSGRSAHAGVEPEKGHNAVIELAYHIVQIRNFTNWPEGVTVTPSVISGGTAENAVPDYAEVVLDVRFLHHQQYIETEQQLRVLLRDQLIPGTKLTLEVAPTHFHPMVCTPETMKLLRLAQNLAQDLGFSVDHVLRGGGSDGCNTSRHGVPTLDGLGPIGGLDHSPDEYLVLDSVAPRGALLAGLIACAGMSQMQDQVAERESRVLLEQVRAC